MSDQIENAKNIETAEAAEAQLSDGELKQVAGGIQRNGKTGGNDPLLGDEAPRCLLEEDAFRTAAFF